MAIKSDLERFLDSLRVEAERTNDPKAWERYLRLKYEVLPNLKTKTVEEVINGLKKAIEKATAGQKDILEDFLKLFQEKKGSSPLTPDEANKFGASSALTQNLPQNIDSPLFPGGIDFTRINYLTRPMGSFQGLDLRLPLLSKAELEGIDIGRELAAMEQMINARIEVSTDRLKRLLAAMSRKDAFTAQRKTKLLLLLLRLCWLKEDREIETTPDFRAVLLIADTGLFVEQGNTKYSLN